jgi:hypothetical protein
MKKDLFEKKKFRSHAGIWLDSKIECDALSDKSIETLAFLISKRCRFKDVYGIPRGGLRLARALKKYRSTRGVVLIVDDVFTTGMSMREARRKLREKNTLGFVIFARGRRPAWIKCLYQEQ